MGTDDIMSLEGRNINNFINSDCPVFISNQRKYLEELAKNPEIPNMIRSKGWSNGIKSALQERADVNVSNLNIYSQHKNKLQTSFHLSTDETDYIMVLLEKLAIGYLGMHHLKALRSNLKKIHTQYIKFNQKMTGVFDEFQEVLNGAETIINTLSSDPKQSDEFLAAINSLKRSRETLTELPDFISQSTIAQITGLNTAARPTNQALLLWVNAIYQLWRKDLSRTISNSNDGMNGRKHLLDFLVFCIEPLHEAIEYETLKNTLRKVQNDPNPLDTLSALNI